MLRIYSLLLPLLTPLVIVHLLCESLLVREVGPELFGTHDRGRANALRAALSGSLPLIR